MRSLLRALSLATILAALLAAAPAWAQDEPATLAVCSFNIQFLGQFTKRDDDKLAAIVKDYDVVVVQELVAPPGDGTFPDGSPFRPDDEAAEFFTAMEGHGFSYVLSSEDTGSGEKNHVNSSATEWFVTFYKEDKVQVAGDLPNGFLDEDRTDHPSYERVPYAVGFRTPDGNLDFVLISVHLKPGDGSKNAARRQEELATIGAWVDANDEVEKDFIILGDMNIEDAEELGEVTPKGFRSLNDECVPTNTNLRGPKPYDHVMYRSRNSKNEIDLKFDFRVYDLIEAMRPLWTSEEPYPGGAVDPIAEPAYDHDAFRQIYSDHHPVVFKLVVPAADDDGGE